MLSLEVSAFSDIHVLLMDICVEDGEKISSDAASGIIITKKIEAKTLISMLVIRSSQMSDAGIYVCRTSNRDAAMINVVVINGDRIHLHDHFSYSGSFVSVENKHDKSIRLPKYLIKKKNRIVGLYVLLNKFRCLFVCSFINCRKTR